MIESHLRFRYTLVMAPPFLTRDPKILGGAAVFAGTEVPLRTLLEYRDAGLPLYEFLLDFPAISREQGKLAWAWLGEQDAEVISCVLGVERRRPASDDTRVAPEPPPAGRQSRRRIPWNRS